MTSEEIKRLSNNLLSDFHDGQYKRYSIIEIFAADEQYYKKLLNAGTVDRAVDGFISKNINEIRKIKSEIKEPGFRRLQYTKIVNDYLYAKTDKNDDKVMTDYTNTVAEKPVAQNSSDRINVVKKVKTPIINKCEWRDYHCIYDHSLLLHYEEKRGIYKNEKMVIPIYKCAKCDSLFTHIDGVSDRKILDRKSHMVNISDMGEMSRNEYIRKACSIKEKKKKKSSQKLNKADIKEWPFITVQPIMLFVSKPVSCKECGRKLVRDDVSLRTVKNKKLQISAFYCKECNIYYVSYASYKCSDMNYNVINFSEIEQDEKEKEEKIIREREKQETKTLEDEYLIQITSESVWIYDGKDPEYCNNCKSELKRIVANFNSKDNKLAKIHPFYCEKCLMYYISYYLYNQSDRKLNIQNRYVIEELDQRHQRLRNLKNKKTVETVVTVVTDSPFYGVEDKRRLRNKEQIITHTPSPHVAKVENRNVSTAIKTTKTEEIPYERIENVPIYVFDKLNNRCSTYHRTSIEAVTVKVPLRERPDIKHRVNAYYCKACDKYYINIEAIKGFVQNQQYLKLHFYTDEGVGGMRNFSELSLHGYNAQKGVYTDAQRQGLLKMLMDNGYIGKDRIIFLLKYFIDFNGKKQNMDDAVRKWKDDLIFVQEYVKGNKRTVEGKFIKKNKPL